MLLDFYFLIFVVNSFVHDVMAIGSMSSLFSGRGIFALRCKSMVRFQYYYVVAIALFLVFEVAFLYLKNALHEINSIAIFNPLNKIL